MPKEVRQIIYSDSEVTAALISYVRQQDMRTPPGYVRGIEKEGGDGAPLKVNLIIDGDDGFKNRVPFEDIAVVAALIMDCRDRKIPVAVKATKQLGLIRGQLALTMSIGLQDNA